jgi:hypothetical protein
LDPSRTILDDAKAVIPSRADGEEPHKRLQAYDHWRDPSPSMRLRMTPLEACSDLDGRSFPRVALRCGFRLADLLGGLVAHPIGVENSRLIDALVSMGAEEVALRLQ